MKYPALLSFAEVLPQLDRFDTIIDVRSESEFEEDHIPGAINCPVLNNDERARVGTLYKQTGSFEAKKVGAALVSRNIGRHIDNVFADKPRDWKPLIYCWRGGNRSGSLTLVLAKIGWPAVQLDGGYREYRRHVNQALTELPCHFSFKIICGTTGSGKTRLLQTLAAKGAQVLDLEDLASHRGSVLGNLPSEVQPSQKSFDSSIWQALRRFDPQRIVFVESESKKIGNLRVPDVLMEKMRAATCVSLLLSKAARVRLLLQDYVHFTGDPAVLNAQLDCLATLHGREKIARWQTLALEGRMETLVEELLTDHYDPAYMRSIDRNFSQISTAMQLELDGITDASFDHAAQRLLALPTTLADPMQAQPVHK